jgi:hypothetical protein
VTLALTIVIGVLSSVLAAQVMPDGKLDWSLLTKVSSFWILLIVSACWIFVHVRFLGFDESVQNFADDEHCLAYIRKAKLEGLAQLIKNNPKRAELVDAKKLLKNLDVKLK